MPVRNQHVQQAIENEVFYRMIVGLANPTTGAWSVTALFYSAMHYLDAYIGPDTPGPHPRNWNHRERLTKVSQTASLASVSVHYEELFQQSVNARYKCTRPPAALAIQLEQQSFQPFKSHIVSLLGRPP